MAKKHEEERFLKAIQKDNGILLAMDYKYLESLKIALNKAFSYGYNTNYDDYYDAIDIDMCLNDIKYDRRAKENGK